MPMADGADPRIVLCAAGVLDPDEALELSEHGAPLSDERPYAGDESPAWRVPPPGLGLPLRTSMPAVMSDDPAVPIGERFVVRVPPRGEDREVVILRRTEGTWEVLAGPVPLEHLARDDDGHRLDLVARGPSGRQRWAVALLSAGTELHGDAPWSGLQRAIATGRAEIGAMEIEVG
jgi:hypothetical protein